jgi:hypothetical protein
MTLVHHFLPVLPSQNEGFVDCDGIMVYDSGLL